MPQNVANASQVIRELLARNDGHMAMEDILENVGARYGKQITKRAMLYLLDFRRITMSPSGRVELTEDWGSYRGADA